jgi:hypothetical protein
VLGAAAGWRLLWWLLWWLLWGLGDRLGLKIGKTKKVCDSWAKSDG